NDDVDSERAIRAARQSIGLSLAAICKQRHARGTERLYRAHHTVATALLTFPTLSFAQTIFAHAQRIRILERLGGRVQTVRHVVVHATHSVEHWPRAHAAGDRFVVRKLLPGARIDAADR